MRVTRAMLSGVVAALVTYLLASTGLETAAEQAAETIRDDDND